MSYCQQLTILALVLHLSKLHVCQRACNNCIQIEVFMTAKAPTTDMVMVLWFSVSHEVKYCNN